MTSSTASGGTRVLEIAHVLFMDIVAYSRMTMEEQEQVLCRLQEAVRATQEFARAQSANQLISLPTGDGMALVFFTDAEAPARCALELSRAVRKEPALRLRMGIHSGPVYRVADINANRNVAGGGINIAQRVMDCGDADHILVSNAVADVLGQLGSWRPSLHDLGEAEVKHGVKVHLYNLWTDQFGNPERPQKVSAAIKLASTPAVRSGTVAVPAAPAKRKLWKIVAPMAVLLGAALIVEGLYYRSHQAKPLSEKDTIVLADFDNKTSDSVFDDTLKQALAVDLEQSPFLNIISDRRVAATLKLMGRSLDQPLTGEVARDLCQRVGSKAMLAGSISSLGSQYVIGLNATSCNSGDSLAKEQARATSKDEVLKALDKVASTLRGKLGESLASVEKFDTPIEQATTPSLEALKAYSLGAKTWSTKGDTAALPLLKRAVELDPKFAMAYVTMGVVYYNLYEQELSAENIRKAYELREKVSERERLLIDEQYFGNVTGELEKGAQVLELWKQTYPRDPTPFTDLGSVNSLIGRHDKALEEHREALRLDPKNAVSYSNLGYDYLNLNRIDEAEAALKQAAERKLENEQLLVGRYQVAFLKGDMGEMERLVAQTAGKPGKEDVLLVAQAYTEAYYGRVEKARELRRRAVESAERNDAKETAAGYYSDAGLGDAYLEETKQARAYAEAGLRLAPNRNVRWAAALALALAGDTARAVKLSDELNKSFPVDTLVQRYWLPTIRAAIALQGKDANKAVELLQVVTPYELGNTGDLDPIYIRGQAYLMLRNGSAAAAEFQKIIYQRGLVGNSPLSALARLSLGRAYTLQGDTTKARTAYQDFLTIWKEADPDIPILKEAKAEYAKLQ